jgi:hypothetical protein
MEKNEKGRNEAMEEKNPSLQMSQNEPEMRWEVSCWTKNDHYSPDKNRNRRQGFQI